MDRIYTVNGYDVYSFIDYAKKNKWIYKSKQNMSSDIALIDTKNKTEIYEILIENFEDNDEYPYMDTLKYYDSNNKRLSNNKKKLYGELKFLEDTDGDYEIIEDERIYVEYYDEYYDEDDMCYCSNGEYRLIDDCEFSEYYEEYIANDDDNYILCDYPENEHVKRLESDIITIYDTNETACEDYASNNLQWSNYHDQYLLNGVWSDYYNGYISEDESIMVYLDNDDNITDYRIIDDDSYFEHNNENYDNNVKF